MGYKAAKQTLDAKRKVTEEKEDVRIDSYISRAFNMLAQDTRKVAQAFVDHEEIAVVFNGRNGSLLGWASSQVTPYPQGEYTREKILANPAFKRFEEKLKEENLKPVINAVYKPHKSYPTDGDGNRRGKIKNFPGLARIRIQNMS